MTRGDDPRVMSASTMIGDRVTNAEGDDLGEVKEIMIDRDTGRIAYAVLSFGGVLGMGDKLFAVPWQALELSTEDKAFHLDIDREKLESAPGFDKDNWPGTDGTSTTAGWLLTVYEHYGHQPYWR